jgi:hypothetical protein
MVLGRGGVVRGQNRENTIYICFFEKLIFSRTRKQITIKLGINHLWVKGILNCSNKWPAPFQREDNHKNAKMGWVHLKIFFRTTYPEYVIFT